MPETPGLHRFNRRHVRPGPWEMGVWSDVRGNGEGETGVRHAADILAHEKPKGHLPLSLVESRRVVVGEGFEPSKA